MSSDYFSNEFGKFKSVRDCCSLDDDSLQFYCSHAIVKSVFGYCVQVFPNNRETFFVYITRAWGSPNSIEWLRSEFEGARV